MLQKEGALGQGQLMDFRRLGTVTDFSRKSGHRAK
jgi:hypothetical protein